MCRATKCGDGRAESTGAGDTGTVPQLLVFADALYWCMFAVVVCVRHTDSVVLWSLATAVVVLYVGVLLNCQRGPRIQATHLTRQFVNDAKFSERLSWSS